MFISASTDDSFSLVRETLSASISSAPRKYSGRKYRVAIAAPALRAASVARSNVSSESAFPAKNWMLDSAVNSTTEKTLSSVRWTDDPT